MKKSEKEILNENIEEKEIAKVEETSESSDEIVENKDANKDIDNKEVTKNEIKEQEENCNNDNIEDNKKVNNLNENKLKEDNKIETIQEEKKEQKITKPETDNKSNKVKKKSSSKAIIFLILFIIFLLIFSTVFAILNMGNSKIIQGVYIENINISNLTKEEVNNIVKEKINNIQEEIELICGEYSTIVKLEEMGIEINTKDAIDKAINLGKTDNIIIDNYQILLSMLFEEHFDLTVEINEEKFNTMVKNIQAEIPEAIKEYSYDIKGEELIITNGKVGQKITKNELRNKIIENIKEQFNGKVTTINIPTKISQPQEINIEKIYNEIYKKSKDAYIVEEPFELHKEENGIDFAISIEEAKKIVKEKKETYIIPLKITKPDVEIKDLGDKLFKQTLAKYTTIYDAGNINRSHNIALAAKTINGTILMPGETFSYNGVLGNTNKEKGYKLGTAYVGGKVVESYGGGICQVSSTLYNSVLYANIEIVERYNHSYIVSYVPAGRDATVAYGGKDFKFKNTRTYPIKIVANAKNGVVSISIMGIKEEKEYEVVLTSSVLSTTPRSVVYENDSSLEEGKQKIIQNGYDGKKSIAYKIIKYNGKTISKTVLSKDTYKPMTRIIQVGTKKVVTPVTTPTVTDPAQTTTTVQ